MILFDTSAAAKCYVSERESAALRKLLEDGEGIGLCELARAELMSVFHRRLREGKWSPGEFAAAVRQFSRDDVDGVWTWFPLEDAVTRAAARIFVTLPRSVFLRASDCLHLVTAIHHHFPGICTYDARQAEAAVILGLKAFTA